MIYCSAGTPVVEIGYARARSPGRSEALAPGVHTCPLPSRAGRPRTYIYGRPRAAPTDTDYYSYFHTMARRLELPFWVVLGRGSYTSPITAPVSEVVATVQAALVAAMEDRSAGRVES